MRTVHLLAAALIGMSASASLGQTVAPFYAGTYSFTDLGTVAGVPTNLGGLTFKKGDPSTLLLGGNANGVNAAIYSVPVNRDANNRVISFGTPTLFSTSPNIDGGLDYGPGDVLFYTGYSNHIIGQIKPGSSAPDKVVSLSSTSIASSVGTLRFVPAGFAGAGKLKIASYNGSTWHDATVVADGSGTYDITGIGPATFIGGGPEGIVYIDNSNPLFANDSILVNEYSSGRVSAYEIDGGGDPIVSTRRDFMTGLN
jgi:hypothetical protein